MLASQKLQLEMADQRKAINAMSAQEEFEVDALDGLNKEYMVLETRYASAVIDEAAELEATATDDLDAEGKEVRGLETRVAVSNYLSAAINDEQLHGAEKELQDALGIAGAGIQVPWVALLSDKDRVETRAATNAPADGTLTSAMVLGRVFAGGAASYLGVSFPTVPVGTRNFPVLSSGVSPAIAAKGANADQTAAIISANELKPKRLTAQYLFRVEDMHEFALLEEALRADLAGAIVEAQDAQVVNGDGSGANVTGFISELDDPTNPVAEATFSDYASARAAQVDGRYAMDESGVRILVGASTYAHAAGIYQTGSGASALGRLMPRVSPHVPAVADTIQKAIASRSQGRAVAVVWPSISLIRDNVSAARSGEISLTAIVLWNFKILDESGYKTLEFKLS